MSVNRTTISGDRNVMKKEAENILKYGEVTTEIQNLWNVKTEVIQLIIGVTGSVSESFTKYLSNIPGKQDIKELQKTAILVTAHTIWKVLMCNSTKHAARQIALRVPQSATTE